MNNMFRGKRIDNGEWVYGYLFKIWEQTYILWGTTNGVPNMIEVDPKTVGQFTGLKDRNGKDIYEGDILAYRLLFETANVEHTIAKVVYRKKHAAFMVEKSDGLLADSLAAWMDGSVEVIGNVHEHPHLLEGDQTP